MALVVSTSSERNGAFKAMIQLEIAKERQTPFCQLEKRQKRRGHPLTATLKLHR